MVNAAVEAVTSRRLDVTWEFYDMRPQLVLLFCLLSAFSLSVYSDRSDKLVGSSYYRGVDGATADALRQLKKMAQAAKRLGSIAVWITFDTPFEGNPELRTPEVIAQQNTQVQEIYAESVEPLIDADEAWDLPAPSALANAPGRMVEVTRTGLLALASDDNVLYIAYMSSGSAE